MSVVGTPVDRKRVLADRIARARRHTDALFDIIRHDALYDRPIPERHRIVFYIGHLEAFDWNLIARGHSQLEPFNDTYDRLFAFGIDPVDGGLPNEPVSAWPKIEEVRGYCDRVRATIDEILAQRSLDEPDLETRFEVAIEHRQMHAETLAYMFHQLPYDRKRPQQDPPSPRGREVGARVEIPSGVATLGLARGEAFGWDNEFLRHTVDVPVFIIDQHAVTNRNFLAFIDAGGYSKRELWTPAAWEWIEQSGITRPAFWSESDADGYRWKGMFAEVPLPFDAPVYVSQAEARAYAKWKRGDLPTEPEFHRAAYGTPSGEERAYPWGDAVPDPARGNFDFERWEPVSCGAYPAGDSAFGVADLVGNGWEWTATEFAPFEGFQAFPFYLGYSANFFDGHHWVMKGGSSRTAACMLRRSFRNWFQAHYPYVYAKFRVVTH
jgi:ergothioneine biosynthesis protein EgtB